MNETLTQLARLAIRNIDQVTSAQDRADILKQATLLLPDPEEQAKVNVTARCIEEAEAAQMELIKNYKS